MSQIFLPPWSVGTSKSGRHQQLTFWTSHKHKHVLPGFSNKKDSEEVFKWRERPSCLRSQVFPIETWGGYCTSTSKQIYRQYSHYPDKPLKKHDKTVYKSANIIQLYCMILHEYILIFPWMSISRPFPVHIPFISRQFPVHFPPISRSFPFPSRPFTVLSRSFPMCFPVSFPVHLHFVMNFPSISREFPSNFPSISPSTSRPYAINPRPHPIHFLSISCLFPVYFPSSSRQFLAISRLIISRPFPVNFPFISFISGLFPAYFCVFPVRFPSIPVHVHIPSKSQPCPVHFLMVSGPFPINFPVISRPFPLISRTFTHQFPRYFPFISRLFPVHFPWVSRSSLVHFPISRRPCPRAFLTTFPGHLPSTSRLFPGGKRTGNKRETNGK